MSAPTPITSPVPERNRSLPVPSETIALKHTQYRISGYTYKVAVQGLGQTPAYLLDKFTGTSSLLENGQETAVSFTVNPADASVAPNRFDVVFGTSLGAEGHDFVATLKVYPNPVTENQFFVQLPGNSQGTVRIRLTNLLGQEVYDAPATLLDGHATIQPDSRL